MTMNASIFRILVVDDEESMRRTLGELLRLEGYEVTIAKDGNEAVFCFTQMLEVNQEFDLVLLDLKMPGKNGIEVLKLIRQKDLDTQVILLTAHGSLQSSIEALRFNAHDYILKPASPEYIIESIKRGLSHREEKRKRNSLLTQIESSIHSLRDNFSPATDQANRIDDNQGVSSHLDEAIKISEGIYLDPNRRQIHTPTKSIPLTPTEDRLLRLFCQKPGKVFNPHELITLIQGYEVTHREASDLLRPIISRLRKKISVIPGGGQWIINVRSKGYSFEPPKNV